MHRLDKSKGLYKMSWCLWWEPKSLSEHWDSGREIEEEKKPLHKDLWMGVSTWICNQVKQNIYIHTYTALQAFISVIIYVKIILAVIFRTFQGENESRCWIFCKEAVHTSGYEAWERSVVALLTKQPQSIVGSKSAQLRNYQTQRRKTGNF